VVCRGAAAVTNLRMKHLRAILLLPGMVLVVIPATILYVTGIDTFDLWQSQPATRFVLPLLGILLMVVGLVLMVATIRLFITVGKRTLAPWNPTQKLVVQGVYRHVRNPMISGVMFILLGEVFLSASLPLLVWFVVVVVVNVVYMPLVEDLGWRSGSESITWRTSRTCRDGCRG
jgi:protein-S-isoprenylcysteine O-methyltransferase Ste14